MYGRTAFKVQGKVTRGCVHGAPAATIRRGGAHHAILCQKDEYLLQLIRSIHLNPVRAGMVRSPERYRYPGDHAYLQGKATATIDPETVLSLLGGKRAYRRFE